jgi:1,4-dihydroxy-2-naphthoate octaprenyltransferase
VLLLQLADPHQKTTMAAPSGTPTPTSRPSYATIWFTAARPHTLTASLCPCLVSYAATRPPLFIFLAWTVFCVTVQIGTNLHNDYSDYVQGADTEKRVGQKRATAQGWISPMTTCIAATSVLSVTLASGIYLAVACKLTNNIIVWFIILSSVFNAYAYTGGPYPLGYLGLGNWSLAYAGLGDIFVLLYFGLVATLMIPYLLEQTGVQTIDWTSLMRYGLQVGLLATNIIVVNNIRDRQTDLLVNKRTTCVRFGRYFSVLVYKTCFVITFALVLVDAALHKSAWRLLPFVCLPMAIQETIAVERTDGAALNEHVGGTARVELVFCILLSIGLLFGQ